MKLFDRLTAQAEVKGGGYFVLIDPDTRDDKELTDFVKEVGSRGVDAFLVGGSLIVGSDFQKAVA